MEYGRLNRPLNPPLTRGVYHSCIQISPFSVTMMRTCMHLRSLPLSRTHWAMKSVEGDTHMQSPCTNWVIKCARGKNFRLNGRSKWAIWCARFYPFEPTDGQIFDRFSLVRSNLLKLRDQISWCMASISLGISSLQTQLSTKHMPD